jgi:hypothetical protein
MWFRNHNSTDSAIVWDRALFAHLRKFIERSEKITIFLIFPPPTALTSP